MRPGYRNWGLQSSVSLCSQAVPRLIHEVQREDSLALSPWHLTQDLLSKTNKQTNKTSCCELNEGIDELMEGLVCRCVHRQKNAQMDV